MKKPQKRFIPQEMQEYSVVMHALASSRGPIIITDHSQQDDPIIYANQAFLDLTGYSRDEIIGENCRFLQGELTDPKSIQKLRNAVDKGKHIRIQIYNYKKDGTPFWNDLIMSPVHNDKGELTHFIGMQLDDTTRMEQELELKRSAQKLERSNQELEQFAYVASHDLQEPLRMIVSYLGLLEKKYDSVLDTKGKKFISYAVDGGQRMQHLINDLLTYSRVKTRAKLFTQISMDEILDEVLQNLSISIAEAKATINRKKLPKVSADPAQIRQLLQNLISNAIKYRNKEEHTKPIIGISYKKDKGKHVFAISDNGIGIEEQYFDRIFTIFQRLHTKEEYPGTGVGLAICKRIIERHGGTIWLESVPKKGSVFSFSLPIKRAKTDKGEKE